jgi:molybdate transport system substrate-binding protein
MRPRYLLLLSFLLAACSPGAAPPSPAEPKELRIAAASNLSAVLPELTRRFEAETGVRVLTSQGASGSIYAQIENGAPFDLFLSADATYPLRLHQEGRADPPVAYAEGRLVLWARSSSVINVQQGLAELADLKVAKVAIANPALAPYGEAAITALQYYGVYEAVQPKLVLGENVSQAAQFVHSGAADAGIIPLSLVVVDPLKSEGGYWLIPAEAHQKIDQAAVVLARTPNHDSARAFMKMMADPQGKQILKNYGFETP